MVILIKTALMSNDNNESKKAYFKDHNCCLQDITGLFLLLIRNRLAGFGGVPESLSCLPPDWEGQSIEPENTNLKGRYHCMADLLTAALFMEVCRTLKLHSDCSLMELNEMKWLVGIGIICQTNLVIILRKLPLLFWHCINATAYHFAQCGS